MSEIKDKNEMGADEMLAAFHESEEGKRIAAEQGKAAVEWADKLAREFDDEARAWHHRKGWEAFGIGCYHGLVALSCVGGLLCGFQWLVLAGIGISSLIMMGGWFHKAKAGWSA